jgi:hypothetical protein
MTIRVTELRSDVVDALKATMPSKGAPTSLVETMMRKDMDKDTPPSQDLGR